MWPNWKLKAMSAFIIEQHKLADWTGAAMSSYPGKNQFVIFCGRKSSHIHILD